MKYYSFYLGVPGSRQSQWLFVDIKQPAVSVVEAVTLHAIQSQYHYKYGKNYTVPGFFFREPSRKYVFLKYRLIVEYERSFPQRKRHSRYDYKKVKEYPIHRIQHRFRNEELEVKEIKKSLNNLLCQIDKF